MNYLLILIYAWLAFAVAFVVWLYWFSLTSPPERWWECSWCGKYFSEGGCLLTKRPWEFGDQKISHGLCPMCHKKMMDEYEDGSQK